MRVLLDIFVAWPMPAIWLLVIGVVFQRCRKGKTLIVLATFMFLLGSLPITGKILLWPLSNGGKAFSPSGINSGGDASAIIVFTAGAFVDDDGQWWPQRGSVQRTVRGMQLQRETGLPLIVTGGSPLAGQPPEAEVIARFIQLPAPQTTLETMGRDTYESGKVVAEILAKRRSGERARRVILVTSPSHIARASAVLRRFDLEPVAAPTAAPTGERGLRDFVPSARGMNAVRGALREYVGLGWYVASGRVRLRDL